MRAQQGVHVNVDVDSTESADLTMTLAELREQYEVLALQNKQEMEIWS